MKSIFVCVMILFEAAAAQAGCLEILLSAQPNQVLLDTKLGLLRVASYDREQDVLEAGIGDYHRAIAKTTTSSTARVKANVPRILNASQRELGAIPSRESLRIAHARTESTVGIVRAAQYFALNAIAKRVEKPNDGHREWYDNVWLPLEPMLKSLSKPRSDAPPNQSVLETWRTQLLFKSNGGTKVPGLIEAIQEIYRLTGENMIRSGILLDYSRRYSRTWTWYGFLASTSYPAQLWLGLNFIPQDVDHYVRSHLWFASARLFELATEEQDIPYNTIPVPYQTYVRKNTSYVPPGTFSRWREIFDVAGTIRLTESVSGKNVLIDGTKMSGFMIQELIRVSYDSGANHVYVNSLSRFNDSEGE
jgi:hypothetical protein